MILFRKYDCPYHSRYVEKNEYDQLFDVFYDKTSGEENKKIIKKSCIGDCKSIFDEDGQCIDNDLFLDISDFAVQDYKVWEDEEEYPNLSPKMFSKKFFEENCIIPDEIKKSNCFFYSLPNGIWIMYDNKEDVHYFFI